MISIDIRAGGVRGTLDRLGLLASRTQRELSLLVAERGRASLDALIDATPVGLREPGSLRQDGPHMRDQWHLIPEGSMAVAIANDSPHASIQFTGSQPHEIRGTPWLVFKVNGHWVKKTVVHHPGTRANAHLVATLQEETDKTRVAFLLMGRRLAARQEARVIG